jgi:hypothetical protein
MGKVEDLGEKAQTKAIKLKAQGMSAQAIADELNKEFNADLTYEQVKHFLVRKKDAAFKVLKEDKNFQEKMAKQYFDTLKQLTDLNSEMWNFFYEIKREPELKDKIIKCKHCGRRMVLQMQSYGLLLKTAEHLLNQIKHVDEVLGKMQSKNLNITYNIVDLSKKLTAVMPAILEKLDRQGVIKLKKKKMKEYYLE